MNNRRVVITGMGVITPIGNTIDEFWQGACSGKNGIGPITVFDASQYDSRIAAEVKNFDPLKYMPAKTAKRSARFTQFAIASVKQAVADSGLDINKENPYRIGVYVGSGTGGLEVHEQECQTIIEKGPSRIGVFTIPMLIVNMASGQIAIVFGFKGPNISVSTACASGSHAIGQAYYVIKQGAADVMITGGAEACVIPSAVGGFCACKALSTRNDDPQHASRPFDKERDGFIMGEGSGIIVLEELEHAQRREAPIYAEMVGYGANSDAYHMTAPSPDAEGPAECMKTAIKSAQIEPTDIQYVNAHGTSTPLNDKIETMAIKKSFGGYAYKLSVSSIKSMTGHLLGAAGSVELITCILAINRGVIPPTINYEYPDPDCDLDYVPNIARKADINTAMDTSLGFGGHNSAIIVKRFIK